MSSPAPTPAAGKFCQVCKQDCSGKPRTKDAAGKYTCNECLAKQPQAAKAAGPGPAATGARPVVQAAAATTAKSEGADYLWGGASTAAKGAPCPSCGTFLKQGAKICTMCGFDTAAGRRMHTKITKEKTKLGDTAAGRAMVGSASVALWFIVGGIACVACLAGWFAIIHYGHIESGWIALLVGCIIGSSIAATGRRRLNSMSGLIAAGYTFFVVAGWKVALLFFLKDSDSGIDDGETFKMLAFSALFAFFGCGTAYRLGAYGFGAE